MVHLTYLITGHVSTSNIILRCIWSVAHMQSCSRFLCGCISTVKKYTIFSSVSDFQNVKWIATVHNKMWKINILLLIKTVNQKQNMEIDLNIKKILIFWQQNYSFWSETGTTVFLFIFSVTYTDVHSAESICFIASKSSHVVLNCRAVRVVEQA
jgi:hypothetical protein